ncbi:hypothetical protein Desde_3156 [Desulfitobacterium dehalogenans ATCC 51507]|uniref:Uncharacterized protein n=1 Tax=Desulfitobacterium dehalogenans (strain ATCC 51507 / DSM 9161 / JW/IU-DC1) TaxID=756499 RepID=I4ABW3_DESDJ|nr:hypothetical protein [Desulfitobacterium dehalogenans]AFM01448.1 hypothetical protein Desde_3156 [Desulfitobacterium dehalogenans ATCC 51507]
MIKEYRKSLLLAAILMAVFLLVPDMVFAETIQESKIFTGTIKMLNDGTTALMIAAPIIGALVIAYFLIRRSAADEMDQKQWNKRVFVALVSVVGVELVSVIINVVTSYYV